MGQILFMAGKHGSIHTLSKGQVRFWRMCLCLFEQPTAQRKHVGDVITEKEIKQCLRDIRGYMYDVETVERQKVLVSCIAPPRFFAQFLFIRDHASILMEQRRPLLKFFIETIINRLPHT